MPKFDNLPQFFEELKLQEDTTLSCSDLLTQFKQQIPANFVYLEIKEKNYQCSTTGWKEPVCERYGFTYENKWIQLDIPHSLLEKLNLKKGVDLPPTFYLAPHLLKKEVKTTQGGITLQTGEIILFDPNKIIMKDQEIQTDLSSAKIKELENTIIEQTRQLQAKDQEITDLSSEKQVLETQLTQKNTQITNLTSQVANLNSQKLTPDEQQAITWINNCLSALNNFLANSNPSYLDSYQSYFNPNGVFHSSIAGTLTRYGRMNQVVTNLINTWNQVRTQIDSKNVLQTQLNTAKNELRKEKGWWDRWIADDSAYVLIYEDYSNSKELSFHLEKTIIKSLFWRDSSDRRRQKQKFKETFYQYYRDK